MYRTKDKSGKTLLKVAVKDTWLTVDRVNALVCWERTAEEYDIQDVVR